MVIRWNCDISSIFVIKLAPDINSAGERIDFQILPINNPTHRLEIPGEVLVFSRVKYSCLFSTNWMYHTSLLRENFVMCQNVSGKLSNKAVLRKYRDIELYVNYITEKVSEIKVTDKLCLFSLLINGKSPGNPPNPKPQAKTEE